jgi:hypothetical protein
MTIAFAIALAVAVIALAALAVTARNNSAARGRERRSEEQWSARLEQSAEAAEEARLSLEAARSDAEAARGDAEVARAEAGVARAAMDEAERRVAEAERRAETFQAEILRAESRAAERRAEGMAMPGAGAVLWQLERLRCEREWSEVVGPGEALPVAWDETLAAVLATEMAIVREVIGTPGQVQAEGSVALSELPQAAATVRLGVELLRILARAGEEMLITVSPGAVSVDQRVVGPATPEVLEPLRRVAREAGSDIAVQAGNQRLQARLALPLTGRGGVGPGAGAGWNRLR